LNPKNAIIAGEMNAMSFWSAPVAGPPRRRGCRTRTVKYIETT